MQCELVAYRLYHVCLHTYRSESMLRSILRKTCPNLTWVFNEELTIYAPSVDGLLQPLVTRHYSNGHFTLALFWHCSPYDALSQPHQSIESRRKIFSLPSNTLWIFFFPPSSLMTIHLFSFYLPSLQFLTLPIFFSLPF